MPVQRSSICSTATASVAASTCLGRSARPRVRANTIGGRNSSILHASVCGLLSSLFPVSSMEVPVLPTVAETELLLICYALVLLTFSRPSTLPSPHDPRTHLHHTTTLPLTSRSLDVVVNHICYIQQDGLAPFLCEWQQKLDMVVKAWSFACNWQVFFLSFCFSFSFFFSLRRLPPTHAPAGSRASALCSPGNATRALRPLRAGA